MQEFIRDHFELELDKETQYAPAFQAMLDTPGGLLHHLYANLHLNKLNPYVSIVAGEALPILPFGFVWSDASHTDEEVAKNKGHWLKIMKTHTPGTTVVWAFHDISDDARSVKPAQIDEIFTAAGHTIVDRFQLHLLYSIELVVG